MDKSRRRLLQGGVAAAGAATFAAGYSEPLAKMAHGLSGSSGEKPAHPIFGDAPAPEYRVDMATGELDLNEDQRMAFTVCYGCTTKCGVRVRIDNNTENVLNVRGNPYHPLSSDEHLDHTAPVREALRCVSALGDKGQENRSTACARGNAMIAQIDSPHRVLNVMKRVGPRGSGEWETIPFEQAIEEICEGGDLFNEGHVDGLRAINDYDTPLDPDAPELGPKTNQLLVMESTDYGRSAILKRFAFNAFGTRNYGHHGSYCGLAFRMGAGAVMNDLMTNAHTKPDFANAEFALFVGTAPSQAGSPFKRQGRMIADARTKGLEYVVVDPALNASVVNSAQGSNWVPVRPGTDTAFAMALIRWLLENDGYAADFLSLPSQAAADAADDVGHTNASHLVITEEGHAEQGRFLRKSDLGLAEAGSDDDGPMVMSDGTLKPADDAAHGDLFVSQAVTLPDGGDVAVASSLFLLREAAQEHDIADYAAECGIPEDRIIDIAQRFKAAGRRAVTDSHGGMMSATGFHAAFGYQTLNLLAGSMNRTGGSAHGGGKFNGFGAGPRYDLAKFDGMRKPKGVFLSRSRFPYEKSSEYKRRKAAGENPYPAKAPWRKLAPPVLSEHLASALDGYPYSIKALIGVMANPLYAQPGIQSLIGDKMADPKSLGLYVAIDGFITETNRLADYIFPDSVMYEVWGFVDAWSGVLTKTTTACWPVVEPRQAKTAEGDPVSMETFFIATAKRLGLAGFGAGAIKAADGTAHDLNRPEDFFLRAGANIAFTGDKLPDASDDDVALGGLERLMPDIEATLPEEERGAVAHLYSRGGRFQKFSQAYDGEKLGNRWNRTLCLHNENVGMAIDSETGNRHRGVPELRRAALSDGTPMREVFKEDDWPLLAFSFKSNLFSAYSAGLDRLRMIKPNNPVMINTIDARQAGVSHGDMIEIESPGGSVIGVALVSDGVMRGALGIEHGFGHRELGAGSHRIDGEPYGGNQWVGAGVTLNQLGIADPTRRVAGTWLEPISGAAVRQGIPVRISKPSTAVA
ncbi:molybdopterin dinucleotide binding domain-containing protein [Aliiroseovarius sediminis]|uniref:molybdopterin dinucleotide binding domain-containing protein n=1 Tax=Aliiroseovarius sediminis TaxID=2925839 RepID=UPI001F56FD1E|nr:molybdopterin dinucleotide binding domain-containing protein [Aliiroseovarius sediminis]MCI2394486.1 tetrathionate reductase subunit TtrA [Aliiroseovarius sediminis]